MSENHRADCSCISCQEAFRDKLRAQEKSELGPIDGLRYALSITQGRRGILSRPPGYLAAIDEIEIFLLAAIERVENGEEMNSVAICQTPNPTESRYE